jgi:uncharacterized protein
VRTPSASATTGDRPQGIGDGLLPVVIKNDHGAPEDHQSAEGAIPTLAASQIIETAITPRFKQGDLPAAWMQPPTDHGARITDETAGAAAGQSARRSSGGGFDWTTLAVFLFLPCRLADASCQEARWGAMGSVATGGAVGVLAWLFTSSLVAASRRWRA